MSITVYGIPNCDTVRKARLHLERLGVAYHFHDFKKAGLDSATIEQWLKHVDLDTLINRKGTTWRSLSSEQQAQALEPAGALALMCAHPSIIKRPVLDRGHTVHVGYSDATYQQIFQP